ncbi:MAG: dTDP-4-dehydrorhamnose 3,5-epimerase [Rhizobiaceae bacterium]|nr:dTDP-4-dehydrorhamnose 3,5-epimerase [Rhizobiaceae bacterium]
MSADIPPGHPVRLIETRRFEDPRGWFFESYNKARWREAGVDVDFVQDNHSYSRWKGTLRGIHYQVEPFAQAKLIHCTRGAIRDFAIDLRPGTPSFGTHVSAVLSAENRRQIYIPVGFGHAFVTLEDETEVEYKASAYYSPAHEAGIRWDDPQIAIPWELPSGAPRLSERDAKLPYLAEVRHQLRFAVET